MNKKTKIFCAFCAIVVTIAVIVSFCSIDAPSNARSQYYCESNSWSVALSIDVEDMERNTVYNISGKFSAENEEDILMRDTNGEAIREMSDDYDFVAQNSRVVLDPFGFLYSYEEYFISDGISYNLFSCNRSSTEKEQVATMELNNLGTLGTVRNMDGEIVAQYDSNILTTDYVVSIFDNCEIEDETVLIMFASCVSDMRADNS